MTREDVKQTMLLAMSEHHSGNAEEAIQIVDAQIAALEAAGVRLVPVEATPEMIQMAEMLHTIDELTTDEYRRAYSAMVALSPYAPEALLKAEG